MTGISGAGQDHLIFEQFYFLRERLPARLRYRIYNDSPLFGNADGQANVHVGSGGDGPGRTPSFFDTKKAPNYSPTLNRK